MQLADTTSLVTGGSRGLGLALARQLAAAGSRVVIVGRDPIAVDRAVAELRAAGGIAHGLAADVGAKDCAHRIVNTATALAGPIDLLIHNASTLGPTPLRLLLDTDCEDLTHALEVNLVGPFRITKIVAGHMALRRRGTIVHISSDAAVSAYPRWGAYGISKAAQDHLSRILAAELADTGVRILAIDPGDMDTAMHAAAIPDADPTTLQDPATAAARILASLDTPTGTRIPDAQVAT